MRYIRLGLILIALFTHCPVLQSQNVIASATGSACDSLLVNFSIEPADVYDTVSSISWNFGDGVTLTGENSPAHLYSQPGIYQVSVTVNSSAILNLSSPVLVYTSPDARFAYIDSLDAGDYSFYFQNVDQEVDTFLYTYQWSFEDGGTGNTSGLLYSFATAGSYEVQLVVENNHGCSSTYVLQVNASDLLEVPNVFTPNMDGYNDFFNVRTNGVNRYEFSVYSKSGTLVYRSETAVISWDGRSMSGLEMQPGIYYYVIKQLDGDPLQERHGFIQLLK